ncbi:Nitronate monooxygenase [Candidatus Ornithobacterium hominis]|uniref:Nitronate monooxygenase n=1 Tax=Candidatus Ornithobacterium hominis TaxID=2497989 RepID=A0A383U1R6_9FLAO|nr:nitronate monooxygenase [Candidatus Ornithobacterium hominis]MCT7905082.1 nitronate monooxygenase [Candidatus Ornithobacterium hominis]SZD73507.1 Nitronate monooxygenase [Candidatus Ornithobacterium hominis]
MENRICQLFGIQYPIIQGGMIWASGWELVSAVSNAGGLGILGAGSMYPEVLREHILKTQKATSKVFGVNLPLMYPNIEEHIQTIIENQVKIVFTSAGNPSIWTEKLQSHGIKVAHVVSSIKFAKKAENAGVDAIVCEGFEAGGHLGKEETTTFCLIPDIARNIEKPLIAAGGIATGKQILAAMILGADAVQMGTKFVATREASVHQNFKEKVKSLKDGDTYSTLKEIGNVRLVKNKFFDEIQQAYSSHASKEDLIKLAGERRAKQGMFEGNLDDGKLEIGQCASLVDEILSVDDVFKSLIEEFNSAKKEMDCLDFF